MEIHTFKFSFHPSFDIMRLSLALPLSQLLRISPSGLFFHVTAPNHLPFWVFLLPCTWVLNHWFSLSFGCSGEFVLACPKFGYFFSWHLPAKIRGLEELFICRLENGIAILQNDIHFKGLLRLKVECNAVLQVVQLILNEYFFPQSMGISWETQLKPHKLYSYLCHWHSM